MNRAARLDPSRGWKDISVVLTDNDGISAIGERHLNRHEVTDVISFRYEPMPGDGRRHGGELIVNVQRAIDSARPGPKWNPSTELALYIAHGCDHLAGSTDGDAAGRTRMRRRELRWLREARALMPIDDLI